MASKLKTPKLKRPSVNSRKKFKAGLKAKTKEKTDRDIYTQGKQAEKNYKKTQELFDDFYMYLQNKNEVPKIPLGKGVRCPIERYRKYYEGESFPAKNSSDYISLRRYIDDNKKMWDSFTASRRAKNRIKKLKKAKKTNKTLRKEINSLKSLSEGFSLNKNNTIPATMRKRIKDEFPFLSGKKELEIIIKSCQLMVGYLMTNTAFIEAFVAYNKESHNSKINDHIRSAFDRFHEIASGK
jgi:hypothetical protein